MKNIFEVVKEKMVRGLFPAVPVPFGRDGKINWKAQKSYVEYMKRQDVTGFAVWVHTGRGLFLPEEHKIQIMKSWRENFRDKLIIAGVGADLKECLKAEKPEEEYLKQSIKMAALAKELGADAALVYAPGIYKTAEDKDRKIIEYHREIAKVGLPIVLFYLYEEAGGISYSFEVLKEMLNMKEVVGIKMATLDSVMTYQEVSNYINLNHPDKLLITGEDRMFGYTLMRGGKGALIGLSSACGNLQRRMMDAYYNGNFEEFVGLSEKVDKLAECTFVKPMEGYIKRMLTVLALLGVIPFEAAYDPFGPLQELDKEEVEKIRKVLIEIGEIGE